MNDLMPREKVENRIAYHEAAHVVVAYVLHLPVIGVGLSPTCGIVKGGVGLDPMAPWTPETEEMEARMVAVGFAGRIAEARCCGETPQLPIWDVFDCDDVRGYYYTGLVEENLYLKYHFERARTIVEEEWTLVEAIAKELLIKKRMGWEEIGRIIEATEVGP